MAAPDGATTKMRLPTGFAAATMVCLCLGCSGPGAAISSSQERSERLTQVPGFETRRQQSAIARRSTPYREPQLDQEAGIVGLDMVIKANYDPHEAFEIFEHLGKILRQRNGAEDVPQALSHYSQAIAADPSLPEPHKAIGLIHLKKGQARSALRFFESALALAPYAHDNDYMRSYRTQCIITIEGEDL